MMLSGCWLARPGGLNWQRWMRMPLSSSKRGSGERGTKYVGQYRRAAAAAVAEHGGRGKARPENTRAAMKAEASEEALSRVSGRVATLARQSAAQLRAERLAAARGARQGRPPGAQAAAPAAGRKAPAATGEPTGDRALRSPALAKRRASTRAAGDRRQAKRDSR